ncbi:MAG: hypothetical protein ACXWT3_00230 [Methylococcaceae bacterium]
MTNMEKFNKCAAEIFSLLYEKFPVRIDIKISNFPEYDNVEDRKIFHATVDFLNSEGFLKYTNVVYGGYVSVVLTSKGLAVLNLTPRSNWRQIHSRRQSQGRIENRTR